MSYALFANYKKEPKKWRKIIEDILESGGSEDPQKVLKRAGVDINDDKFWQKSFETIEEWQNELEKL